MNVLIVTGTNPALLVPHSDNNLINGKMLFDCSLVTDGTPCINNAGLSQFRFTPGKIHRLRVINAGSEGLQRFSIDGHLLTVIANDFTPIAPYQATFLTLGVRSQASAAEEGGLMLTDRSTYRRPGYGRSESDLVVLDAIQHI